jgi:sugar lactone lactonase YvrE
VGLVAAVGAALAPPVAAQAGVEHHAYRVIADHLNNPRGLAPAPGGGLYLAEAGSGGKTCFSGGETGTTCVGRTGSLDRVTRDRVTRLVTGLISGSGKGGVGAEGPVSVSAGPEGSVYGQFAMSSHELPPPGVLPAKLRAAAKAQLGHLVLATPRGSVTSISDVGGQDWAWTNAHKYLAPRDFPDANPNAVLNVGGHRYVVDAGANALVEVKRDGTAKLAAFFGVPRGAQSDAVPTCVARGPDGALYVGELLGGFYAPGHARIWRVVPGHAPAVWARGLTTVQGCGFGADGAFYATEFQVAGFNQGPGAGDVVRIDNEGHRTHLGARKLFYPSGFAAGPGDTVYVSNCSIAPAHGISPQVCSTGGQVVRVG